VKREKFDWTTGGDRGDFAWVDKHQLNIDGRYQRDKQSEEKVLRIARDWDWLILGALSVILREDGTLWVFDGGHRTRASFYRDDVQELPCMVHSMDSLSDEAKAFVARNSMVTNVGTVDRFKAASCAGEPTAMKAQAMMDSLGLKLCKGGGVPNGLACIGLLQQCIAKDEYMARECLMFCQKLSNSDGTQIVGRIMVALFELQMHFKDLDIIKSYGEKLLRLGTKGIELKMNQYSVALNGRGGKTTNARCLMELCNYKARNRLEW
jgi:hypothetical protein